MPASFLLNMSLDPAAPLSRFEVLTKKITEKSKDEITSPVFEQTIQYRCNGANSVSPTMNPSDDLLCNSTMNSFKTNNRADAPSVANFHSNFENKVTFRKPI